MTQGAIHDPSRLNLDLFRAASDDLDPGVVARATDWIDGRSAAFPRPVSVHIDMTLQCTARCIHCSQWTWREHPYLASDQLDSLIATLGRWQVRTITLGGGNPLLHPNVAYALRRAADAGISVGMITEGGVELSAGLVEEMSRSLRWIRFSLDGPVAQIHDDVRNSPGLFDRTMAMIRQIRRHAPQTAVGLNCVIQQRNILHLPAMMELARDLSVDALLFKLPHGDDPARRYLPSAAQWSQALTWMRQQRGPHPFHTNLSRLADLLGETFDLNDVTAGRPVRGFYAQQQARCYVPLLFLVVDAHGDVFPCDYLQADTRPMSRHYRAMRARFHAGNIFADGDAVLDRLGELMRSSVHELPSSTGSECSSCTRFFHLNAQITAVHRAGAPAADPARPDPLYFL